MSYPRFGDTMADPMIPEIWKHPTEITSPYKVFVGGLAATVTNESLSAYCSHFGAVSDAVVMIDKYTSRSRGFGFVTFETPEGIDTVLGNRGIEHMIDGKKVQFKRAVPASFQYNPEKIFVGGLPSTCDSHKLHAYFERYGPIVEAQVMYDRNTGRSRGFGYVNYEESGSVESALKGFHSHTIDDKWIEVKRCVPNDLRRPSPSVVPTACPSPREGSPTWMSPYAHAPNMFFPVLQAMPLSSEAYQPRHVYSYPCMYQVQTPVMVPKTNGARSHMDFMMDTEASQTVPRI